MTGRISPHSAVNALSAAVLALFVLYLFVLAFFPLNRDDGDGVVWLYVNSRALHDDFYIRHFYSRCFSQLLIPIPPLLMPGRAIASFFHPASYAEIRVAGMLIYLLVIAAIALVSLAFQSKKRPLPTLAATVALLSLGIVPYHMISIRPESLVALGTLLFPMMILAAQKIKKKYNQVGFSIAYFLLCSWFFSIHPKCIMFAPIAALAAWCIFRHMAVRMAMLGLMACMAWQAYGMWQWYTTCEGNILVTRILQGHAVAPEQILYSPADAWAAIQQNLAQIYSRYIAYNLPNDAYFMSDCFSKRPLLELRSLPAEIRTASFWLMNALLACAALVLISGFRYIFTRGEQRAFLLSSFGMLAILLVFMGIKNGCTFYENALIWPLCAFTLVIAGTVAASRWQSRRFLLYAPLVLLLAVSAASQATILHYGSADTFHNMYPPHNSKGMFVQRGPEELKTISTLAQRCGIALDQTSRFVVFDSYTYLAVKDTSFPLYGASFGNNRRFHGKNLFDYLNLLESSGIIMHCRYNHMIRSRQVEFQRLGDFCCVGQETIRNNGGGTYWREMP
jgi:hypothetical protein